MKILIIDFTNDREEGIDFRNIFRENFSGKIKSCTVIRPEDTSNFWDFNTLVLSGSGLAIDATPAWFNEAKTFVKKAIQDKKSVFSVCYGAQFLARIHDAKVGKSQTPEFGKIYIKPSEDSWLFKGISELTTYSAHFDEIKSDFKINNELVSITASTKRCAIQAYELKSLCVAGVEFHPEKTDVHGFGVLKRHEGKDYLINDGKISEKNCIKIFQNFIERALSQ